ncbi:cilia- and flagella- associated protein 210 [Brachyistius frenatus]|uniref:cilia- and flagella- associated protein 210 n=1 Tax=Brachyistius frenatus TaxID=100188 RepID=UPI0037E83A18
MADEAMRAIQPPDLRQVAVLSKTQWQRIQDELNQVDKDKESRKQAVKEREALHLQSKEVVKQWSNTITGQREKKLEAKKIREQIEEEKRKQADIEEAKYKEQKRNDTIDKAKTQLYYQTERVKGLNSALQLTEVLKEREAQIELQHRKKSAAIDVEKKLMDMMKSREVEAESRDQKKELLKKLERQAVTEDLKTQIKENEKAIEQQKLKNKKDGEAIQRFQDLHQLEQKMESERKANQKRELMRTHLKHLRNRDLIRAADAQKEEAEEEQRKLHFTARQNILKLRKEKEKELFREAQKIRESIMEKMGIPERKKAIDEERWIAKAIAEGDARRMQKQREDEKKKTIMLKLMAAHRELMIQEKEQQDQMEKQNNRDTLQAKKDADRIFSDRQQLKAKRNREEGKKLQEFYGTQMAEKNARCRKQRDEEREFEAKCAELDAEEETKFRQYSQQVIDEAAEGQRHMFPLQKAAREGLRRSGGVQPSQLVQEHTGATDVKKLYEAADIQEAKKRLGFLW